MNAKAPAAQLLSWRLEKCIDRGPVEGIEEARYLLDAHSAHHCGRYLLALGRVSEVMG